MPELPEVETTRRGLLANLQGQRITKATVRRYDLRFPIPKHLPKSLANAKILDVRRRAKYLLIDLDGGRTLLVHLGMSGSFRVVLASDYVQKTHDHVILTLENGTMAVFHDPRRFGMMDIVRTGEGENHPLLAHLGPEPLERDFSPAYLSAQLARRKAPIKPVLMDQKLVVGVGNIYASEALFLAKIHPEVPAQSVVKQSKYIIHAIRVTLEAAIASGGSTLRDFVGAGGEGGYFQHHFQVYGRNGQPCFVCKEPIKMMVQAGRATYWCAQCQPQSTKGKKT